MENFGPFINGTLLPGLITVVTALVLLLVVYIIARIIRGVIRKLLSSTNLDNRLSSTMGGGNSFPVENIIAQGVFFLIMLFGIMAVLDRLNLGAVAGPIGGLLDQVTSFLPNLIGALILGAVAFVIGTVVRTLVVKGAETLDLDNRLSSIDDVDGDPTTRNASMAPMLGTAAFAFIIFMFLPAILERLGMQALVAPFNGMLSQFLDFIPNLIGAAIIAFVGFFIAKLLRQLIGSLLGGLGVDNFGKRAGLDLSIAELIGTFVFAVIMLLTIVQALGALNMPSISGPATAMIDDLFGAFPRLLGAAIILGVSYIVGKIIAGIVESLLASAGFDGIPGRLGLNLNTSRSASNIAGMVVLAMTMLLALTSATSILEIDALTNIVNTFIPFVGNIILGIVLLGIGVFIANFVRDLAKNAGASNFVATLVRAVVMVLVGSMALSTMGIGSEIVELAFGIGLASIGVAAALAFGLGGRTTAGRELERFVDNVRSGD